MSGKWLRSSVKWPHWFKTAKNKDGSGSDAPSPEELEQSLLKNLECPVCYEYMTPPIMLCSNGHNICHTCRPDMVICPNCRQEIMQARNYALEELCLKLNYPCKFLEEGCKEMFTGLLIREHQAVCNYGTHECPLGKILEPYCNWKGPFKEMIGHLQLQHSDNVHTEASIISPETHSTTSILLKFDEIFLYYKCFRDGKCYCVVQMFGTRAQASKFKYKVKFCAENQIEEICHVLLVGSITEHFEDVFRTARCVRLDQDVVSHYSVNRNLQLTVEISRVREVEEIQEPEKCKLAKNRRTVFSERPRWPWCRF